MSITFDNIAFTTYWLSIFYGKPRRKRFSKSGKFSGVPLSDIFHTWAPDEPNNLKDNENCIFLTSSGTIGDTDCYSPRPYVCYRKNDEELVLNECGTTDYGGYIYNKVLRVPQLIWNNGSLLRSLCFPSVPLYVSFSSFSQKHGF